MEDERKNLQSDANPIPSTDTLETGTLSLGNTVDKKVTDNPEKSKLQPVQNDSIPKLDRPDLKTYSRRQKKQSSQYAAMPIIFTKLRKSPSYR